MDRDQTIERARTLRQADRLEDSQDLLFELMQRYPDDPLVLFEVGGSFDVMGEESSAIPYYQEAIEAGLAGGDLQECLVCLGSSLRVTGRFAEAATVLERSIAEFPDRNSARAFLALTYYSQERYDEAVRLLLELLLSTTEDEDILGYEGALDYYKDHLDEIVAE